MDTCGDDSRRFEAKKARSFGRLGKLMAESFADATFHSAKAARFARSLNVERDLFRAWSRASFNAGPPSHSQWTNAAKTRESRTEGF
jgi:hypothetical protein